MNQYYTHSEDLSSSFPIFVHSRRNNCTYNENMSAVGERLRHARKNARLTLGQVQEYDGILISHMSEMENGKKQPTTETITKLAKRYHVSADYLLGIVDDPEGRRGLSPEVLEVLSVWGSLDSNQRRLVMDTMRMLARVTTPHIIGGEEDDESI